MKRDLEGGKISKARNLCTFLFWRVNTEFTQPATTNTMKTVAVLATLAGLAAVTAAQPFRLVATTDYLIAVGLRRLSILCRSFLSLRVSPRYVGGLRLGFRPHSHKFAPVNDLCRYAGAFRRWRRGVPAVVGHDIV
jgi:hypothetical protein